MAGVLRKIITLTFNHHVNMHGNHLFKCNPFHIDLYTCAPLCILYNNNKGRFGLQMKFIHQVIPTPILKIDNTISVCINAMLGFRMEILSSYIQSIIRYDINQLKSYIILICGNFEH